MAHELRMLDFGCVAREYIDASLSPNSILKNRCHVATFVVRKWEMLCKGDFITITHTVALSRVKGFPGKDKDQKPTSLFGFHKVWEFTTRIFVLVW